MAKRTARKCKIAPALAGLAVPLNTLHLDRQNVRSHDEANLKAIRDSYRRFGQQKPIVVDAGGRIIAGNGQYEAAVSLGWTHIAVVKAKLTEAEAKAFAVADNRASELGAWDDRALAELLSELREQDADLLDAVGFTGDEVADLLGESGPTELVDLDARPAPRMAWVLVGIPTERWGEIADKVSEMAQVDGVFCETAVNDDQEPTN